MNFSTAMRQGVALKPPARAVKYESMLATSPPLAPVIAAPRRARTRTRVAAGARLLFVLAAHAGALALGLSQIEAPIQTPVTTIQVALIAPPAPAPVSPPAPEVVPPKPPVPEPVVKQPPTPPKPKLVRKPAPKPTPKPAPAPSPTAISEPKEEAPAPSESAPPPPALATAPTAPSKAEPGPVVAAPQPVIAPRFDAAYLNNPEPRYPRLSSRMGETGKVLLRVLVGEDGKVNDVRLHQSSGHSRLDEAARRAVSQWTFVPARQGNRPIANWVIVPIEFKLENT
ncbi:energy transducer TonB [Zoogloeaceae bacterium G21618-S1]|nr:energy transducer TonB [Zoogloeaceae bacterium G21618-S1]